MKNENITKLFTPIEAHEVQRLDVGTKLEINGVIYCGRDAVLPKLVRLIEENDYNRMNIKLKGSVLFHTAVSPAGIGPTTSNKVEIEESFPALSKAGVRIHIGKGSIGKRTVEVLKRYNSVFAVTPPVSALFSQKIVSSKIVAFEDEGMEALFEIVVKGFPAIVASANGKSIYPN